MTVRLLALCSIPIVALCGLFCPPAREIVGSAASIRNLPSKDSMLMQESRVQSNQDGVTVRGAFVIASDEFTNNDWSEFESSIVENIVPLQPKLPENWIKQTREQQMEWLEDFWASEDGRAMSARNKKLIENRKSYDITIEKDGRFVVYDVPKGTYNLQGSMAVAADGKKYSFEIDRQFSVGDVDEIDLAKMNVDILRVLSNGDDAPDFAVQNFSGKTIKLSSLRGKFVFLSFGLLGNPTFKAATDAMKELQKSESADKLQIFVISVDQDNDAAKRFVEQQKITWECGLLGGFDTSVLYQYGLRSVPSFWVIDPEGKIVLTGTQFVEAFNRKQTTIQQLVLDTIKGRANDN